MFNKDFSGYIKEQAYISDNQTTLEVYEVSIRNQEGKQEANLEL